VLLSLAGCGGGGGDGGGPASDVLPRLDYTGSLEPARVEAQGAEGLALEAFYWLTAVMGAGEYYVTFGNTTEELSFTAAGQTSGEAVVTGSLNRGTGTVGIDFREFADGEVIADGRLIQTIRAVTMPSEVDVDLRFERLRLRPPASPRRRSSSTEA